MRKILSILQTCCVLTVLGISLYAWLSGSGSRWGTLTWWAILLVILNLSESFIKRVYRERAHRFEKKCVQEIEKNLIHFTPYGTEEPSHRPEECDAVFHTPAGEVVRAEMKFYGGGDAIKLESTATTSTPPAKSEKLPEMWELFSFLLPRKTRRECFEPAYNDLRSETLRARKFHGKWARRWISFCFILKTALMLMECLRVLLQSGTGRIILGLLPESLRNWWRRQ